MENDTTPEPKSRLTIDMPARKPRGFKVALIILGVLLLMFVGVIVLLPYFLPIGTIRNIAKSQAKELAGVDVDFDNLHFGWNGDIVLDGIRVAPLLPDGTPGEPLLTVNEARTNVALTPLLSGKAVVNSVDVNGFALHLVRDADGRLNLPDFGKQSGATARAPRSTERTERMLLSTAAAAEAPSIPPVEIHQVNLRDGLVLFTDAAQGMELDLGVSRVTIEGGASLDEPFALSGEIHPYAKNPELGAVEFTGSVAMLRNGALNPDGKAGIDATVTTLSLGELAEKLGLAQILPSAFLQGTVKIGYADRKAGLVIPGLTLSQAVLGLGQDASLPLPDTQFTLSAAYDPALDAVDLSSASLKNALIDLTAGGRATGLTAAAEGGIPGAELDFGGSLDFSRASQYLSTHDLGLPELPELEGRADFSGQAILPAAPPGGAPAPTLSLSLRDGDLHILENATGIAAGASLRGVSLAANASLDEQPSVHSRLELAGVPVSAYIPQIGDDPVAATLTGGVAFEYTPETMAAELRASGATATLPATPWSQAANLHDASAHITADLKNDVVTVHALEGAIGDSLRARVAAASLSGVLSGAPRGSADIQLAGLLEHLRQLVLPVYPAELVPQIAGSARASVRVRMENSRAEAILNSELDNVQAQIAAGGAQAELRSPKGALALLAVLDPANPAGVTVQTFEASGARTDVRVRDASGTDVSGQIANALVKLAARVDGDAGLAEVSSLSVDVGSLNFAFAGEGGAAATLTSGLLKIAGGAAGQPVRVPLSGAGDFSVPVLDFGVDNLLFRTADASGAEGGHLESHLGNVRARLVADGYIGSEKRQLVNIRTASLSAAPAAVNSRAQMDLGAGSFLAEYAARVAPSGLSSILAFLGLPPALLTNASATGTVAFDNGRLSSKGAANGELNIGGQGGREITPFETAHDLSAAWNPNDRSLALEIRRLDGNLKTSSGEAVATLSAQPSQLLLSRAGSRGLLDIRLGGSAGPTRALALGLAGVLPQMRSLASTLASTQAGGLYNAWVQVREKDPATLGFNVGGSWKGAALAIGGTPYLSEAGELSAALEGDLAYQENAVRLSRLQLRSESAQIQAGGTAAVTYAADANHLPTGLANVNANLQFTAADVALAGRVFPGVLPGDLGLAGRVDGALAASGDAGNVQISQAQVAFRNFRATPSPDLEVTIPQGAANFAGSLALHFNAPTSGTTSPYDIFRMFDVNDGRAAVTGALIRGKQVNNLSAAFALRSGILTLSDAQVVVGGGADGQIALNGAVDFTRPAPAVNVRLALRNIPLAEANSEIRDYVQIQQGALNIPAQQGQAAGVAFAGFSENEILQTLRLDNFTFGTGPVTLLTGPALNAELDKARAILKMSVKEDQSREITLASIDGSAVAAGDGVISFPEDRPINVVGDNTSNFRAQGSIRADHSLDMRVMLTGHLEKIITIPNIAPNLSLAQGGEGLNLMSRMNENAARGNYGVHVTGALESPDISGIGLVAMQFLKDVVASIPTQLLGNVLDAPESVLQLGQNILGGATHPGETLKNAPENLVRGLGGVFGLGGDAAASGEQREGQEQQPQQQRGLGGILGNLVGGGAGQQQQQPNQQQTQQAPQSQQQQQQQPSQERQLLQGLGRMLGGNR